MRLGVAPQCRGLDTFESRRARVGPAKPLLRFAVHLVRRCAVIGVVALIKNAAIHPWHVTLVHRRQRLPQFVVELHAAIAPAVHNAPQYRLDLHGSHPRIPLRRTRRPTCVMLR